MYTISVAFIACTKLRFKLKWKKKELAYKQIIKSDSSTDLTQSFFRGEFPFLSYFIYVISINWFFFFNKYMA